MRLLRLTDDDNVELTLFGEHEEVPKYAVLSHTWLSDSEEENFLKIQNGAPARELAGYEKIRFCGEQATKDGLQYFWVDTCCIDKRSSQEITETITRMYQWYRKATRCYVYLTDVSVTKDVAQSPFNPAPWETSFHQSRWFTRGWTLQELLAPRLVEFYSVDGVRLGDKYSMQARIHAITGISLKALQGEPLDNFSIPERLSWAHNRQTKRKEDRAYSLLGIVGIFMPLIYGEGEHAFVRLDEEISKRDKVNDEQNHLLDTLPTTISAAFNSFDNQYLPMCLPQTRVELLREIETWANGTDNRRIFWLNGIAGTGKSTVARTIAKIYKDTGKLGGSFFFSRGGGDTSHADRMVTTLASQMATNIPSVKRHICEAITEQKGIPRHSLRDQWEQLIIGPLSKTNSPLAPSTVVLVLDALDQCDSERDIRIIIRLLTTTDKLKNIRLRIFVTSRPENVIRTGFQGVPTVEHCALHDVSSNLINRDIKLLFEDYFKAMREERGFPPDWPDERAVSKLVDISSGLMLWAYVACRYIWEGKKLEKQRIYKLTSGHRSGVGPETQLDRIYITVLQESIEPGYEEDEKEELYQRLRVVLGNIVTLFSALPVGSLANLLQISAETIKETLADLHTILKVPSQSDLPIRLHHPTFREFLLNKARCSDMNFWVDGKGAHRALADSCIRLMSRNLKQNICGLENPGFSINDVTREQLDQCITPELRYACLYWVEHYRQSGIDLRDDDSVHRFIQDHFLHWVELMSLMRKSSAIAGMIRMYHSLLRPDYNAKQGRFVADARRLLYRFQATIERAPLQIYCAALVFNRPSNQLRRHFWGQLHPCFKYLHVADADAAGVKDEYSYVNELAFTPDGTRIASGSIGPWVRMWSIGTKGALAKFEGQTKKVSCVTISPDGAMIAGGSDDTTIKVWEIDSTAERYTLTGHDRWVNTVAFSPDGQTLASGSMDETIRLWDATNGKELKVLNANSSCINSIAFSPDSSLIASGTVDQMILLWNIIRGAIHSMFDGHSGPVNSVQFSPSGLHIASGSDDMTIRLWSVSTGTEIRAFKGHTKKVCAVAFSHDATVIASGSEDRTVRLWNVETGEPIKTLCGHTSGINAVLFSPSGKLLASGSFNDEVRLWNAQTGAEHGKLADFRGDDSNIPLITHFASSSIKSRSERGYFNSAEPFVVSPDGQLVACTSHQDTIELRTMEGTKYMDSLIQSGSIEHLDFSPDGSKLLCASNDGSIKLWDPVLGTLLDTLDCGSSAVRLARFSPDGSLLASCSSDRSIRIWHTTLGTLLRTFTGHPDTVNNFAFSPDNRIILSCLTDGSVYCWDVDMQEPKTAKVHEKSITSLTFSSDGQFFATCSSDGIIKICDIAGTVQATLLGHSLQVHETGFSNDSKRLVSCSDDLAVRIWNLETLTIERVLDVGVVVRKVAFSPCNQYIETDRGRLIADPNGSDSAHSIFVTNDWVKRDDKEALWLPDDYHVTKVAVCDETIIMAHSTGAISFIKF